MKRKQPKYHLRYAFQREKSQQPPDYVELSLVESEKARLRTMARMLENPAATEKMRERGEELLDEIARRLAGERIGQIGSAVGTQKRLAAGAREAAAVNRAVTTGDDPLNLTSERNLRRIKNRDRRAS